MEKIKILQDSVEEIIIKISDQQIDTLIEKNSIIAFYEAVAASAGIEMPSKFMFDCSKIFIAKNILERWEKQFGEQHGEESVWELFMHIANSGPATDAGLEENKVRIIKGFVLNKNEEKKNCERERVQKQNKIRVFIINGIIDCAYSTDPETEVEIVDFDKCKDSNENLDVLYEECVPEMHQLEPTIIHPDW